MKHNNIINVELNEPYNGKRIIEANHFLGYETFMLEDGQIYEHII